MLLHIYSLGRFGPERQFGFVIADNADCICQTTYVSFDIVKSKNIPNEFWTNPKGIGSTKKYRKWKNNKLEVGHVV